MSWEWIIAFGAGCAVTLAASTWYRQALAGAAPRKKWIRCSTASAAWRQGARPMMQRSASGGCRLPGRQALSRGAPWQTGAK